MLTPEGLLLIEVPNPSWRFARTFGRWWIGLMQPQHQHLIPMDNLLEALSERGFTTVATESGPAHMGIDATFAFPLMLDAKSAAPVMFGVGAPDRQVPWLPDRPGPSRRSRVRALWSKAVLTLGFATDKALTVVAHRTDDGSAYRVLARRDRT